MSAQTQKALKAVLDLIPNAEAKDFWNRVYSGKFTPQDLANELSDFHVMIENVPKVYMAVTGGLLSKQMYDADVVIAKFNDYVDDIVQENVKEALAQPAQEPVAVVETIGGYPDDSVHTVKWLVKHKDLKDGDKLYTHPAPSWQGLDIDDRNKIFNKFGVYAVPANFELFRAIEQALKEKNT